LQWCQEGTEIKHSAAECTPTTIWTCTLLGSMFACIHTCTSSSPCLGPLAWLLGAAIFHAGAHKPAATTVPMSLRMLPCHFIRGERAVPTLTAIPPLSHYCHPTAIYSGVHTPLPTEAAWWPTPPRHGMLGDRILRMQRRTCWLSWQQSPSRQQQLQPRAPPPLAAPPCNSSLAPAHLTQQPLPRL